MDKTERVRKTDGEKERESELQRHLCYLQLMRIMEGVIRNRCELD